MAITKRIGFLGSGQMAEALARGMIAKGVVASNQLHCSDPNPDRLKVFTSFGATAYQTNTEVRACQCRRPGLHPVPARWPWQLSA